MLYKPRNRMVHFYSPSGTLVKLYKKGCCYQHPSLKNRMVNLIISDIPYETIFLFKDTI